MTDNSNITDNTDYEDIMKAFFSQNKASSKKILNANKVSDKSVHDERYGFINSTSRLGRKFGFM